MTDDKNTKSEISNFASQEAGQRPPTVAFENPDGNMIDVDGKKKLLVDVNKHEIAKEDEFEKLNDLIRRKDVIEMLEDRIGQKTDDLLDLNKEFRESSQDGKKLALHRGIEKLNSEREELERFKQKLKEDGEE